MFKPTPLVLVNIQVAEEAISKATAILTRLRIIHLINLVETPLGKLGLMGELEKDLMERYRKVGGEVDRWAEVLEIPPRLLEIPSDLSPAREIYSLEELVARLREQVAPLLRQFQEVAGELKAVQRQRQDLESLRPAGLAPAALGELKFVFLQPGWLPNENLTRLAQALERVQHALIPVTRDERHTMLVAAALARDREAVARALKGAFFEPLSLPEPAAGSLDDLITAADSRLEELAEAGRQLRNKGAQLRDRLGGDIVQIRDRIDLIRTLLKARVLFGKVGRSYLISGWIPAGVVDRLTGALGQELKDQAEMEVLSPEAIPGAREGVLKIPILFNNPYLLRPFERLTATFGTPAYREVEPTAFLAVSFLLMFGLMFGDLGQGAVLFALGYLIFRRFFRYTDYGIILMEGGVASMLFGILYGSVFGVEGLIPALWFVPMKNPTYFIKVAIVFGMVAISLGVILGLVNAFRLKAPRLPATGLLAALIYWILAGMGVRYLLTGAISWDFWMAVAAVVLTVAVGGFFVLQRLWLAAPGEEVPAEGLGMRLLEGLIEVVDGTMRFVANTFSFIRIAAFALAHAALFIGVFSLAETLSRLGGGGLAYWVTILLGNAVIILLEGLVVSIQIVRLEYYEFMSKFFHGGGAAFTPLQRGFMAGKS